MAINAGDLNLPARFYRPNRQHLASGASAVPGDGFLCQAWVAMRAVGAGEQVSADAVTMVSTFELTTRWRHDLSGDLKVLVRDVLYEVDGPPVDPDGRQTELRMMVHPATTR